MKKTINISDVVTATKVGTLKLISAPNKKWFVEWCNSVGKELLKNKMGRVYLIVVNGVIYKIGGSADKKGIFGTMGWYEKNAWTGGPSIRTHGIHVLCYEELLKGNSVEVYMILSNVIEAEVKGLFGTSVQEVSIDFKVMEDKCKQDYHNVYGKYPPWNFQENGEEWALSLVESCNEVNNQSAKKRKK
jgi:hypothetical protein